MAKIGYDLDQTLTRTPHILGDLVKQCNGSGIESYLITGRPPSEREEVIDILKSMGLQESFFKELLFFPEEYHLPHFSSEQLQKISEWKAQQCKRLEIDILFEDNVLAIDSVKRIHPKTLVGIIV